MVFSSFIFLCYFLPLVLFFYFCSPNITVKNLFLLIFSCFFYAWSEPKYLFYMLLVIFGTYVGGICIYQIKTTGLKQCSLLLFIILILSGLFYFKYFNFAVLFFNDVTTQKIVIESVILPIGISFYTFQAISYLVDVYRGHVPQKNFFNLALYISMFPQLVAGPIVRYETIEQQLTQRQHKVTDIYLGCQRFLIGLSKKIIIADTLAMSVDKIFSMPIQELSPLILWVGILFYALQIYFDFSGYSDMAIGLGRIFGFKFLENFNYPYLANSITDFWRRWHISLSSWFKEYVYIPLGGNRKGLKNTLRNVFIVFFLTGLWHGAEYTFVIWGLWYALFIMFEKIISYIKSFFNISLNYAKYIFKIVTYIYTVFVVLLGWVFFRAPDLNYACLYIKGLFNTISFQTDLGLGFYVSSGSWMIFVVGFVLSVGLGKKLMVIMSKNVFTKVCFDLFLILSFFISIVFLTATSYSPFIYFQF